MGNLMFCVKKKTGYLGWLFDPRDRGGGSLPKYHKEVTTSSDPRNSDGGTAKGIAIPIFTCSGYPTTHPKKRILFTILMVISLPVEKISFSFYIYGKQKLFHNINDCNLCCSFI